MSNRTVTITITVILLVILLVLTMHLLAGFPTQIEDSILRYENALRAMPANYSMAIEESVTICTPDIAYTEKSHITLHASNQQVRMVKKLTSDNYTIQIRETYADGMIYSSINEYNFCSPVSKQTIIRRYIPSAIFDCKRYQSITGTKKKNAVTIYFSTPTSGESWALPSGAELIDAFGTAHINKDGQLTESNYEINYRLNEVEIKKRYSVTYIKAQETDVLLPENITEFMPVDNIDNIILLERLCGILMQTKGLSSTIQEDIFCGAFGDQRNTVYELNGNDSDARIKTTVTTYNSSQPNNAVQAVTENNEDINHRYYNLLLGGIPALEHVENVKVSGNNSNLQITCIPKAEYAHHLTVYICDSLYESPDILTARATTVTINELDYTIKLDDITSLPQEINILFRGIYTLDGIDYPIEYTLKQTFQTEKAGATLLLCCYLVAKVFATIVVTAAQCFAAAASKVG